jgi:phosphonate transport system substrate-binding protein
MVYEAEKKAGKIDETKVQVIWESPTFPDYQFTVRGDVDATFGAGFKAKLTAAILAIDDKDILASFERAKFIPARNDDYKPIEEVAKASNLLN